MEERRRDRVDKGCKVKKCEGVERIRTRIRDGGKEKRSGGLGM